MSDAYAYGSNGPIEPFWQRGRVNRFFLLPLDKVVLARIGGLSVAFVASFALLLFGGFGVLLLMLALLAILVTGAAVRVQNHRALIQRVSASVRLPADRRRSGQRVPAVQVRRDDFGLRLARYACWNS